MVCTHVNSELVSSKRRGVVLSFSGCSRVIHAHKMALDCAKRKWKEAGICLPSANIERQKKI